MKTFKRICVFCGSNPGLRPEYLEAATAMGTFLAKSGIGLVYGGSKSGLMGAVADAALKAGGEVIGVIPSGLVNAERAHGSLADLRITGSMHERKAKMAELSDAFVALPGGFGTFEEFCEILTWTQLGLHDKPCGILNVAGYYDPLLRLFQHAAHEGFVRRDHLGIVIAARNPKELIEKLAQFEKPAVQKWGADGARGNRLTTSES